MEEATVNVEDHFEQDLNELVPTAAIEALKSRMSSVERILDRLQADVSRLQDDQKTLVKRMDKRDELVSGILGKLQELEKYVNLLLGAGTRPRAQRSGRGL